MSSRGAVRLTIAGRAMVIAGCAMVIAGCAQQSVDEPAAPEPFYKTLETPPAPVLSADEALQTFVLPAGFSVRAIATEPLIEDPVAADWDEDGRLYVAEMRAYMPDVDGTGEQEPIGEVVRLSDTDGDGVFDRREVMLDGLVLPRAVRVVNEGLLVGEMGKLWLCPSGSGWSKDIDCRAKQFLGAYGEHQGSVEHAENGLLVGIDNWIYSAKSNRRLRLVDGALEQEPTLFRGQWGITQDDLGRLYYNTNSNLLLGDYYDAQGVISAGNRGAPGLGQRISPTDEVLSVRVNPGVNRAYVPGVLRPDGRLRGATSASGMVVYRGGRMRPEDPDVFVAEPAANLVAALRLKRTGLTITSDHVRYPDEQWGERDFFASTDERFRPVDVMNGPDGALYVVDFYRGVIQDHVFLSEQLRAQALERGLDRPLGMGRIWRIARQTEVAAVALPDWSQLSDDELIDYLAHDNGWARATAQRLLLRSGSAALASALAKVVAQGVPARAALHALWTLEGRGELTPEVVRAALARGSADLSEAALVAGGALLSADALVAIAGEDSAGERVRFHAISALGPHLGDEEVRRFVTDQLTSRPDDAFLRTAVQVAARGHEIAVVTTLMSTGGWQAEQEQPTNFIRSLSQQLVRAEPERVVELLEAVGDADGQTWLAEALLLGVFERTREPDFERIVLEAPHPLFSLDDDALWPVIAKARRGVTWPGDTLAADAKPLSPQQQANHARGAEFYASSCANCHGADGEGVGALGPPLAGSDWVTGPPERLARIVLQGVQGPIVVRGQEWNSAMPGHQNYPGFDDAVASGLLNYVRRAWGHAARAVDAEFVAQVREATAGRSALWTAEELNDIELNTHYAAYAGRFGQPQMALGFEYDGKQLLVRSGIFNGPLVEEKEDHFLFEPRQLRFEFVVENDGSVPVVRMNTPDGALPLPRIAQ